MGNRWMALVLVSVAVALGACGGDDKCGVTAPDAAVQEVATPDASCPEVSCPTCQEVTCPTCEESPCPSCPEVAISDVPEDVPPPQDTAVTDTPADAASDLTLPKEGAAYYRLYATEDNETHIEIVTVPLVPFDYAPPAPKVNIGPFPPPFPAAVSWMFLEAPAGWDGGFHPSPKRQMVVVARGEVEVTASDGTAVIMKPGDLAISEDLPPSKGHKSTNVGGTSGLLMIIELPALVTE